MARRTYVISVKKPKCKLLLQRQNYAIHDFFIYKVHIRNTGGQNERKRRWCDQKNGYNTTSKGVSEIRHVSKNTQQLSKWKIFRFM